MKVKLYNAEVDITEERNAYREVRRRFANLPDAAVDQFNQAYRECGDCHQFADIGYAKGRQIIAAAAQVGVDYLIERGCYDLTHEVFVGQYLAPYLTWGAAFSEWDSVYAEIIAEGAEMEAHRQRRMQNRSRFVGGGFGIAGAVKGIAMAGAANAAWGMAHGLRNAIGSASTRAAQKKQLSAFFNDEQNRAFLANAIHLNVKAVHVAVFEFIVKNADGCMPAFLADLDLVERAVRLQRNLMDGKIPVSAAADVVPEILEGNPYDDNRYRLALSVLGDPDHELECYGLSHDIDVLDMKLQQIKTEINPLFSAPQFSPAAATEQLTALATRLGCLYDDEVAALMEKIDQKGRTLDKHIYATVDEMQQAERERDRLRDALGAVGSDLGEEQVKLAGLKAQSYVYHGADAIIRELQDKLDAMDMKQRKFDGHVYSSQAEAQQARTDKKAIHAVFVVGSQISQDLDKEREKLAQLRTGTFVYRQAGDILDAYEEKINSEELRHKTYDGQVYPSRAEAEQARQRQAIAEREARVSSSQASDVVERSRDSTEVPAAPLKSIGVGLAFGLFIFPFMAPLVFLRKAYTGGARMFAVAVFAVYAYVGYNVYLDDTSTRLTAPQLAQSSNPPPLVHPVALTKPAQPDTPPATSQEPVEAAPPFVGKRMFNFMGGNGTQNAIVIDANGQARVESLGTTGSAVDYEGPFVNPLPFQDGRALLFRGGEVHLLKGDTVETGCAEEGKPCVSQLYAD